MFKHEQKIQQYFTIVCPDKVKRIRRCDEANLVKSGSIVTC